MKPAYCQSVKSFFSATFRIILRRQKSVRNDVRLLSHCIFSRRRERSAKGIENPLIPAWGGHTMQQNFSILLRWIKAKEDSMGRAVWIETGRQPPSTIRKTKVRKMEPCPIGDKR